MALAAWGWCVAAGNREGQIRMPWADPANFNLTLLCTALAAAVLAGIVLAIEFFASPLVARRVPGVLAGILAAVALCSCWLKGMAPLALGCATLAGLLLVDWPVRFEATRQRLIRLVGPRAVWVLVLGTSMIASRYLAAHVLHSLDRMAVPEVVDLADFPVRTTQAVTDQGRSVALFHFKMNSTDEEIERFIATTERERTQLIRLAEANPASNCHGWIFTGGRYGIRDGDVAAILADNGYEEVNGPSDGDLAVYEHEGAITHLGLVRLTKPHTPIFVESKWGPFGVYLHAVEMHPFPGTCKFYRSQRTDHLLVLKPMQATENLLSAQLPAR